ncbi:MAG: tetratricopeptide repeat protein [Acidobacteria bacterium]|nr:tetratricopeptide repeat protein [Acidobacteriota bacterium]
MSINKTVLSFIVLAVLVPMGYSQGTGIARPTPAATPRPVPKLSSILAKNLETIGPNIEVSRENREQAFAKLLEGQRYVWSLSRTRSANALEIVRMAKQAFQKAVELDPSLAEGYTALAELSLSAPPNDVEESLALALIAVKVDKNNFGSNRILARLYTIKSRLNTGNPDAANAEKAKSYWKEISRLDPRNAEAWAFLSEFYRDDPENRIAALKSWIGSAQTQETRFYRSVMGGQADLSPESATILLGAALVDAKRFSEAVDVLNQAVADDPENPEAVEYLSRAIDNVDAKTAATSVQAIQAAIYANPGNTQLILLLAKIQTRAGNAAETSKFLNDTIARLAEQDKAAAAGLQIGLGEIYGNAERYDEAVAEFRKALTTRGIATDKAATDEERDFAIVVFERIIQTYKAAGRFNDAKTAILESQKVLGDEDSFTDRQLIALYRENGKKAEALQAVKYARVRFPDDYGFLRTEAMVLTELGRVDEGVAIVKSLLGKQNPASPSIMYDDFSNHLFIAILFGEAKRGKDSVAAANQAIALATDDERLQIAQLTLATGQQVAGDFVGAETTLRGILKRSPQNPIALNNLGYFLVERGQKLEEALKFIQQALAVDPENSAFLDSLGWAYFKLGKLELAEENLKKALKLDPASATLHDHLGDVYEKQGKSDLARQMWQRALGFSSDPEQTAGLKQKILGKKSK